MNFNRLTTGKQTGGNKRLRERIAQLERENAVLRDALRVEWEAGHAEHCSRNPHGPSEDCRYPPPPELFRGRLSERGLQSGATPESELPHT